MLPLPAVQCMLKRIMASVSCVNALCTPHPYLLPGRHRLPRFDEEGTARAVPRVWAWFEEHARGQ